MSALAGFMVDCIDVVTGEVLIISCRFKRQGKKVSVVG